MTVDFNPVWTRAHDPWNAGFVTVFSPALISELARNTLAKRRGQVVGGELRHTLRIDLGFFGRDHFGLTQNRRLQASNFFQVVDFFWHRMNIYMKRFEQKLGNVWYA